MIRVVPDTDFAGYSANGKYRIFFKKFIFEIFNLQQNLPTFLVAISLILYLVKRF